jgi:hypothetical protein
MSIFLALLLLSLTSGDDKQSKLDAETVSLLKQFCDEIKSDTTFDVGFRQLAELSKKIINQQLQTVEQFALEKEAEQVRWFLVMLLVERNQFDGAARVIVQGPIGEKDKDYILWKGWDHFFGKRIDYRELSLQLVDALLRQFEKGEAQQKLVVAELFRKGPAEAKMDVEDFKKAINYKIRTSSPEQWKEAEVVAKYRQDVAKLSDKPTLDRLRFYFDNVDHTERKIANDAIWHFERATRQDVMDFVKRFGDGSMSSKILKQVKRASEGSYYHELLHVMVRSFPEKEKIALFKAVLADPDVSGINADNFIYRFVEADPVQGWEYVRKTLASPKENHNLRYACVNMIADLRVSPNPKIPMKELVDALGPTLEQPDLAETTINSLRSWKEWQFTDKILEVSQRPTHQAPIFHEIVPIYMMSCPLEKYPAAREYIEKIKKTNPERLKRIQKFLDFEKESENKDKKP